MIKKSIKLILLNIIAIIVFCSSLYTSNYKDFIVKVNNVLTSVTTHPDNPASYLIDEDYNTSWSFKEDSKSGWAELYLNENIRIYGIEITCNISDDTKLTIEFEKDGIWNEFAGVSFKNCIENNNFIDLSYERIVTNKIALRVNGANINDSFISEIQIIGKPSKEILHSIK